MRTSPTVWREPHRAKRQLQESLDRREKATWKRQTVLINQILFTLGLLMSWRKERCSVLHVDTLLARLNKGFVSHTFIVELYR